MRLFLVLVVLFSATVYGYIAPPVNIIDSRIKLNLKLAASSSIVYNDSIYVYGGAVSLAIKNVSSTLYKYELNEATFKLDLSIVNTTNAGPQCFQCQPVHLPGTSKLLVLAVDLDSSLPETAAVGTIVPYVFDFQTLTWTNLGSTAVYNGGGRGGSVFQGRYRHSIVLANDGNVYMIGGTSFFTEEELCPRAIVSYNPNTNTFNVLDKDAPYGFVSAVAYVDSNDQINLLLSDSDNGTLYTMDNNTYGYYFESANITSPDALFTLNISSGDWSISPIGGEVPYARYSSTAQFNPSTNLLHVFGGQYADPSEPGVTMYGDVLTLNTTPGSPTWYNYSFYNDADTLVEGRAVASSVILKNKYFLSFFGQTIDLTYNVSLSEIDIFALPETVGQSGTYPMTLKSFTPAKPVKSGVSILALPKRFQFLIVIAVVAAIILLWIFIVYLSQWCGNIDSGTEVLVKMLYDRRIGEPVWTEVAHCIVRILCFVIFVLFIIYCYDNIANTTISSTSETETLDNITYPDVRFCITNYNFTAGASSFPSIQCQVKGESYVDKQDCTKYIHYLDSDIQSPLYDYSNNEVQCWLFKSDSSSLVSTAVRPTLIFYFNDDPLYIQDSSLIYASIYPTNEDPLRYIFFDEKLPDGWSQDDVETWAQFGDNGVQALKKYAFMNFNDSLSITFDTKTYNNLNPRGAWNYIGSLFPSYITTENFTQAYENRGKVSVGPIIELSPITFDKETITYKRDNTILGAIATAGGILGLMTTIIICIFGDRPFSAWGMIHIAFRNKHERLLSDTLDTRLFKPRHHQLNTPDEEMAHVPLATPVETRFMHAFNEINQFKYDHESAKDMGEMEDMQKRLMRLEARNQMMEIVLKAYYIDDHIFHTLNQQRELNPAIGRSLSTLKSEYKPAEGDSSPSIDSSLPPSNVINNNEKQRPKSFSNVFKFSKE